MDADRPPAPNPYEKPLFAAEPAPPRAPAPQGRPRASFAQRLAGGAMIANGVFVMLEVALSPSASASTPGHNPIVPGVSSLLDVGIGISLLAGSPALATFAIVRCALGLTVGIALRVAEGPFGMIAQAVLCLSLLGLLAGKAERVRTAIAASGMGLYLALYMLTLTGLATGSYPLGAVLLASQGDIETSPVERAAGVRAPYEISLSGGGWYARKPERFAKESPLVDRWFVHPKSDVHLLVVVESTPERFLPVDAYADAVIENTRRDAPSLVVASREPWPLHPERGRLVRSTATIDGAPCEWRHAFLTTHERALYLVATGRTSALRSLQAELHAIFDSLRLPPAVLDALPPDLAPGPAGKVTGALSSYSIEAPSAEWHVRKPEAYRAENPAIDLWLTRPDLDAHVIVVTEETPPDTMLPPDRYKDAVLDGMKSGSTRFEVISQEPWTKHLPDGYRVHVSLTRGEVDLEYEIGIHAQRNRGTQVQAFTSKATFATARADLVKVVESFEPPPQPPPPR